MAILRQKIIGYMAMKLSVINEDCVIATVQGALRTVLRMA
jgi:hypothetical protein